MTPLRVGLLLDGLEQPRWVYEAIQRCIVEGHGQVALVIRNAAPASLTAPRSRLAAWVKNRHVLAYAAYNRLDAWKVTVDRDPFAPTDIGPLVAGVDVLDVVPRQTKFSDYFEESDVERILGYDLDVAVRFGFRILRGRALHVARHGVWSYHHGDNRVSRGGPPGFWEVMESHPATGAILQVLSESLDDGQVLCRGWSRTDRYSVRRSRARYYWQAAPFLSRALRDLAADGVPGLGASGRPGQTPVAYGQPLYTAPTTGQLLRKLPGLAVRYLGSHLQAALSTEQWILGYRRTPGAGEIPDLAPHRFRMLVPPNDRFWADPFPIRVDGRDYVFFEEFLNTKGRAHISVFEVDEHGEPGPMRPVLVRDYHLSYPFVFRHEGAYYLVPESQSTGRVELWRASQFPDAWELVALLTDDRPLVDATIAFINGRWWMFAAGTESGGDAWDELFLYHADSPLGPWKPHARNPVVSDVRSARPAGRIFRSGSHWYRPAQDGSRAYGGAITLQRIDLLDEHHYGETPVTRLEPRWRPDLFATHSVSADAGLTTIDARRRRWFWQR